MASFSRAFDFIIEAEGGYVNLPSDPGGPTQLGISWRAVRFRDKDQDGRLDFDLDGDGDVDEHDIRLVTKQHAARLFAEDYWDPCQCSVFPDTIAIPLADCAYNQGTRAAIRLLQQAAGAKVDGIMGPKTIQKVLEGNIYRIFDRFMILRMQRYAKHPNVKVFIDGWTNRMLDLVTEVMG